MGHHCCSKQKVKRGLWSPEEDEKLMNYITTHGHGCWSSVPKLAGLQRCGKSCRLRWINYLRPDLKRGTFSANEERIIIDVHRILGNRWAQIAKHLPGRTDNEVKNFWNSCIKKKLIAQGLDPKTHNLMPAASRAAAAGNTYSVNGSAKLSTQFQQPQNSNVVPFTISPPFGTLPTLNNSNDNGAQVLIEYQENDVMMSFKEQDQCGLMDYSEFGMGDACNMWGGNSNNNDDGGVVNGVDNLDVLRQNAQELEAVHNEMNEDMYSAAFDLDMMESTLNMSCGIFSNIGTSMEQLQWDC